MSILGPEDVATVPVPPLPAAFAPSASSGNNEGKSAGSYGNQDMDVDTEHPPMGSTSAPEASTSGLTAAEKMMRELNRRVEIGGGEVLPEVEAEFKATFGEMGARVGTMKRKGRFDDAHEREFSKMASIVDRPGKRPAPDGERNAKRFKPSTAATSDSRLTLANAPAPPTGIEQKKIVTEREAARKKTQLESARQRRKSLGKTTVGPKRGVFGTGIRPMSMALTKRNPEGANPAVIINPEAISTLQKAKKPAVVSSGTIGRSGIFKAATAGFKNLTQGKDKDSLPASASASSSTTAIKPKVTAKPIPAAAKVAKGPSWKKFDLKESLLRGKKKASAAPAQIPKTPRVRIVSESASLGDESFVRIDNETTDDEGKHTEGEGSKIPSVETDEASASGSLSRTQTFEDSEPSKDHSEDCGSRAATPIALSPPPVGLSPGKANVTPKKEKPLLSTTTPKVRAVSKHSTLGSNTKSRAIARSRMDGPGVGGTVKKKGTTPGTTGKKTMSSINREGNRAPWK
ncbi:hypothetical protein BT69DRAFT_1335821 [Atractiella rhizophila]|nr:hypothetical protein BT69DRAFT_1335821 [Atractiella rhizophila]